MWWDAAAAVATTAINADAAASRPAPMLPNQQSTPVDQIFDNSGWTVSTGRSSASAERSQGINVSEWMLLGLAAVLVVGWIRSK